MRYPLISIRAPFITATERGVLSVETEASRSLADYRKVPRLAWLKSDACFTSLKGAREALDTAARTIRFMDHASLRASGAWVSLFGDGAGGMRDGCHPSGFDHTEVWNWFGSLLVTTEPYRSGEPRRVIDWCVAHGWQAQEMPEWAMWNPPQTTLFLCAPPKRGAYLDAIVRQLNARRPLPVALRETAGTIAQSPRLASRRGAT